LSINSKEHLFKHCDILEILKRFFYNKNDIIICVLAIFFLKNFLKITIAEEKS